MGSIQRDEIQWEKSERITFKGNAEQEKIRGGRYLKEENSTREKRPLESIERVVTSETAN